MSCEFVRWDQIQVLFMYNHVTRVNWCLLWRISTRTSWMRPYAYTHLYEALSIRHLEKYSWKYLVKFLNVMPAVLFTGDSIDENPGDNSGENPDRWVLQPYLVITVPKLFGWLFQIFWKFWKSELFKFEVEAKINKKQN